MINLITSFSLSENQDRNDELLFAINKNLENKYIKSITVISENNDLIDFLPKHISFVKTHNRPTYKNFVDYANNNFENDVVAITNGDIFFDESLELINFNNNYIYCLTRWLPNVNVKNPYERFEHWDFGCSFDTYIFKPKVFPNNIDFKMGIPGCDNRFSFEMSLTGLLPINPSKIIKSFHAHGSNIKTYTEDERLRGNYLSIITSDKIEFNRSLLIFE